MRKAIIIGAGPAGLTAAYELLKRTDIIPIVLEKSGEIGGISRTTEYKGNRMDMGPHRFFSKSDRVMQWWLNIMPLENNRKDELTINYQNKIRQVQSSEAAAIHDPEKVMLVIPRLTRIYFLRKFFAYPIQLGLDTLRTLGLLRTIRILLSFLWIRLFPRKPEKSLEDFIINKFGKELYLLFFKDYTEKVWGIPCDKISAEWGAQRIKGVSLSKAIAQAVKSLVRKKKGISDIGQKETETSLIEQFLYPKRGPGALWEEVARQVQEMGGKVYLHQDVANIIHRDGIVTEITTVDAQTGKRSHWEGDYFFSSMPVQELIAGMDSPAPEAVREVAGGLQYRDFINVGILLKQLSAQDKNTGAYEKLQLKDNWIYIQERDVKVGRLMIYNNWGEGMIKDPKNTWIGMEYFCNKTDDLWAMTDEEIQALAVSELEKMELIQIEDVLDTTVRRMEKTYPAYFGTYDRFEEIREYVNKFENLFLVGRNGMHKYNNADHSMLTAMVAVDNIVAGVTDKENLWSINTEQEYHEEKQITQSPEKSQKAYKESQWSLSPFKDLLWNNKWNRAYIITSLLIYLLQFILFKIRYPFANYMPDSYHYLEAAARNVDVNTWPVAYSKFLRLVSVFTHSDVVLTGIQYFFMQVSTLVFLLTIIYHLQPGKTVRNIMFGFFLLNPVPLYVANYISADALFIGLSLLWFSTLIWILYRPMTWQMIFQAILLLACFTVRYNAIYYPLIAGVVFLLSRQTWKRKVVGIGLGISLVACSMLYTTNAMYKTTGKRQFSAFGGWQMANNALYMYENIPAKERGPIPARFSKLEAMVRQHMDTLSRVKLTHQDTVNSYFYLWSDRGPLVSYMSKEYEKDSTTPEFKRWASEGPLYSDYAFFLIKKYPMAFAKSFLVPNALKYAIPPTEFLGTYNMGKDSVGTLAKDWFNYKSLKVNDQRGRKEKLTYLTIWYPVLGALVNTLLIIMIIGLLFFGGMGKRSEFPIRVLLLLLTFWLVNAGFSVFASPVVLRYQVFPVLVIFALTLIGFEETYRLAIVSEKESQQKKLIQ